MEPFFGYVDPEAPNPLDFELTQGLVEIPNFLRDLPQSISNDADWLEVALIQKYAPFVSEMLFFDAMMEELLLWNGL